MKAYIILESMDAGAIIGLIIFIPLCFFLAYLLIAFFSKITNTRTVYMFGGDEIANPKTFDFIMKQFKIASQKTLLKIKKINKTLFDKIVNPKTDKVERLQTLQTLKEKGTISEKEFEDLKQEILSNEKKF